MSNKPLMVDLFCGLGGWASGGLAEGYNVVGFDIERHAYGDHHYPAQLVLQDVLTLHGRQFKGASLIVASPPCQAYSYRAMPWKRAKALPPPDNSLFEACFRIQSEACEAAGRHIPMVVENVRGAQKWVGRARWHFGSFYLWGDIPALMPMTKRMEQHTKIESPHLWLRDPRRAGGKYAPNYTKNSGGSWFNIGSPGQKEVGRNPVHELMREGVKNKDADAYERNHPAALGWKSPRTSSHSSARKAASAMIAKIPFVLARHIAAIYKPAPIPEGERER